MSVKQRIKELGIILPEPPRPVGLYVPLKVSDGLVFVSGMLPVRDGELIARGKVPSEVSLTLAQECARQIVLNLLALVEDALGLDSISGCIRMNGYVASESDFYEQPMVLNAASELLNRVFGEGHTRVAIGVPVLPMNSPLEMDFILSLKK